MDYRKLGGKYFLRIDKGGELLSSVLELCRKEEIHTALFHGIGAFGDVRTATYIPEIDGFHDHSLSGMLELLSLDGNIIHDEEGNIYEHTHAMFSYLNGNGEMSFFGGHLKEAVVSYTAEIVVEPVPDPGIGRMTDPYTGIPVWRLS